jgi:hypothetical protein
VIAAVHDQSRSSKCSGSKRCCRHGFASDRIVTHLRESRPWSNNLYTLHDKLFDTGPTQHVGRLSSWTRVRQRVSRPFGASCFSSNVDEWFENRFLTDSEMRMIRKLYVHFSSAIDPADLASFPQGRIRSSRTCILAATPLFRSSSNNQVGNPETPPSHPLMVPRYTAPSGGGRELAI